MKPQGSAIEGSPVTLAGAERRTKTGVIGSTVPSAHLTLSWSRRVAGAATAGPIRTSMPANIAAQACLIFWRTRRL